MKFLFEYYIEDNFNTIGGKRYQFPIQVLLSLFEQFEEGFVFQDGLSDYLSGEDIENAYYVYLADQDLRSWGDFPPVLPTNDIIDDSDSSE